MMVLVIDGVLMRKRHMKMVFHIKPIGKTFASVPQLRYIILVTGYEMLARLLDSSIHQKHFDGTY